MTPYTDSGIIAIASVVLLVTAGYLIGVRRGYAAREKLRAAAEQQRQTLGWADIEQQMRATIEQALAPLVQHEQLSIELSSLEMGRGARNLTLLLDKIAGAGDFTTVALSDSEGLPFAGNSGAQELERVAVNSSLMMLVAERIGSDEFPAPTAILMRDTADRTTLYRIFDVQDQKVALTAVTSGTNLATTTLDPVLAKVSGLLTARPED